MRWFAIAVICGFAVLSGCQKKEEGPKLYDVEGKVTLNGNPLKTGSITFDSKDGKGGSHSGEVKDGAFKFQSSAGPKIVRFAASEETSEKDQYGSPISKPLIPEQYSGKSTLEAEVKAEGPNTFEYKLEGKP